MAFPSIDPSAFGQMPSAMSQGFTTPQPQQGGGMMGGQPGGMFAGMSGGLPPQKFGVAQAISAALNGYLAAMPGPSQQVGLAGIKAQQARQQMSLEEQVYEHRQNLEMQRQMMMLPLEAQLKLMYPDNADAQAAYQSGLRPGTPEWLKYMGQIAQNKADPPTMTPQGPMLTSQVRAMMQPPAAPVGKLTPLGAGGPASQAPGGFPGY